MNFILVITLIFTALIFTAHSAHINRIVGGKDASEGEFPYQISIQDDDGDHFCGGSLISESWIVSAAHCEPENWRSGMEAVAGEHNLKEESGNEQRRKVVDMITHEDYKGGVGPDDIAVLKVEEPFELNGNVAVIKLPEPDTYPRGSGVVSGWGSITGDRSEYPDILQKATLPIHTQTMCNVYWAISTFSNRNICAGPLSGSTSICSGDSGGPLVQGKGEDRTLVGVVSWGAVPCGRALSPGVFVQVSKYIDWINKNAGV